MSVANDFKHYLKNELTSRIDKNSRYSLRAFSKALEIDIGALSQIISGKRLLSLKKAKKIIEKLDLEIIEKDKFLKALANEHKLKKKSRLNPELRKIAKESSSNKVSSKNLAIDQFAVISNWYHYAILELTQVDDFKYNESFIAKRLNISQIEVKLAIERLIKLELLELQNGKLIRTDGQIITSDRHLTSAAHKKRQKQILEKSIFALENISIDKRNHTAMTIAIDPKLIPQAKEKINLFINELSEFLESGQKKNVYELTVNLFSLEKETTYEN